MSKNTSIRVKAAFMLTIFALNMAIGFACAIGVKMGFNETHHHVEEASIDQNHSRPADLSHHHNDQTPGHHHSGKEKGNCCTDEVAKLAQADKAFPQSAQIAINPLFFAAFVSSYYQIALLPLGEPYVSSRYFLRSYHPPIPDIRIAIQSFQI